MLYNGQCTSISGARRVSASHVLRGRVSNTFPTLRSGGAYCTKQGSTILNISIIIYNTIRKIPNTRRPQPVLSGIICIIPYTHVCITLLHCVSTVTKRTTGHRTLIKYAIRCSRSREAEASPSAEAARPEASRQRGCSVASVCPCAGV